MIAIAVGEEMVFRGYILNNLMQSLNRWLALAISAALFALMHSNNPNVDLIAMVNLFGGGLLLGINYIFTKNLWFSIMLHTAWNFLQGPVLGFPVSGVNLPSILHLELKGSSLMSGGAFGLEASLITSILVIVAVLLLYIVYRSRTQSQPTLPV
jgi:membrane protease YdiL (CAAX protease family)